MVGIRTTNRIVGISIMTMVHSRSDSTNEDRDGIL